ncbi:MAG: Fic family protein [Novosphingobium sp.]
MAEFSLAALPEVFVSDSTISKAVYDAVDRGHLRKLGSRLYTRNLQDDPQRLVRRNWYNLIISYYPDAVISDRTALESKPAEDGSVFLISAKRRETELPGLVLRPRPGAGPLDSDRPLGGVRLASTARAYLENLRPSRARGGRIARTVAREELEKRLDAMIRQQGEAAANRLRDDARLIAPQLGYEAEAAELDALIGSLLGTREAELRSDIGKARHAGQPYDPARVQLFEALFTALRETVLERRPAPARSAEANAALAFFEAYFSNFIEGTEFSVEEAAEIVFEGVIPAERPADAHDVLGTFRVVSDLPHMKILPGDFAAFRDLLRRRHATVMEARPDKRPGAFKEKGNQAGATVFVAPDLVEGTLERGFAFLEALDDPFHRAVFMMVFVSEVHPFADGNGRVARIMMNAELLARDQERIIIPTAYRTDYLGALKAFSHNGQTAPLIRMLDVAQDYTHGTDWSTLAGARAALAATNAFAEGEDAKLRLR